MKAGSHFWKMEPIRSIGLILLVFLISGCQSVSLGRQGRVSEENRIPLVESGKDSGSWNSRDLRVDYQYVRNGRDLKLSGKVVFSSVITGNFSLINYFHTDAIFLDEQGNVVQRAGLLSSANSDPNSSESFSVALSVPEVVKSMAFSYQGQVRESGNNNGGSWSYIWHYPIH